MCASCSAFHKIPKIRLDTWPEGELYYILVGTLEPLEEIDEVGRCELYCPVCREYWITLDPNQY